MNKFLYKYFDKLFFKQWIIGICRWDINEIIRSRSFDPDIKWFYLKSFDNFLADPFFIKSRDENIKIIFEDYPFKDDYGKIALMTIDKNFNQVDQKLLLDTGSHLSYPFVYYENDKIFVIPESANSGKLTCYEYDPHDESLKHLKDLIEMPLRDATILRYNNKYWIFAIIAEAATGYTMHVFFSDHLLGPYTAHKNNPVKDGFDGTRSAGNFIEVDGVIYRPAQNCMNSYGESMTIYKLTELNENSICEEPYLTISMNEKDGNNLGMHSIHTLNHVGNLLVVDGEQWTFAPFTQLKKYISDISMFKNSSKTIK